MLVSFSMGRVDFLLFISVLDRHKGENSCWKLRVKYSDSNFAGKNPLHPLKVQAL